MRPVDPGLGPELVQEAGHMGGEGEDGGHVDQCVTQHCLLLSSLSPVTRALFGQYSRRDSPQPEDGYYTLPGLLVTNCFLIGVQSLILIKQTSLWVVDC